MKTNLKMIAAGAGLLLCVNANAQWTTSGSNAILSPTSTLFVGINTSTPATRFQMVDGTFAVTGSSGSTTYTGAGTRMLWVPAKAAFRAGAVAGNQWDDASIGMYSFATGQSTKATGTHSFASGFNTLASGTYSFSGGSGNTSSGSHAFTLGTNNTASGLASIAVGASNIVSNSYSFAGGGSSNVSGGYSFSYGTSNTVVGHNASAFGYGNYAPSYCSFVVGRWSVSISTSPTAWVDTHPLFIIANGTSTTARNNAVTVLKNGNVLINKLTQANSAYLLDVNGTIRANEIVVNTTGADFVFEEGYLLTPLAELEKKVLADKHLPGIASAAEMQANGVGLAELNKSLLQKTEELTLYIIELNKKQEAIVSIMEEQKKEIEQLKNK